MSDVNGRVPLQISADFLRTYDVQTHEMADAIAVAVSPDTHTPSHL